MIAGRVRRSRSRRKGTLTVGNSTLNVPLTQYPLVRTAGIHDASLVGQRKEIASIRPMDIIQGEAVLVPENLKAAELGEEVRADNGVILAMAPPTHGNEEDLMVNRTIDEDTHYDLTGPLTLDTGVCNLDRILPREKGNDTKTCLVDHVSIHDAEVGRVVRQHAEFVHVDVLPAGDTEAEVLILLLGKLLLVG